MKGHLGHRQAHHRPWTPLLEILSSSNQMAGIVFMFFLVFGQFSLIPFFSPSLVANVGLKEGDLPLIYAVGGAISIVSSPLIGRIADQIGKQRVFYYGAIFSILPFFLVTHLAQTALPLVLILTVLFFLGIGARAIPAQALVTSLVTPEKRGAFMSLISSAMNFSSALAAYTAGLIVVRDDSGRLINYNLIGYVAILFTLFALFLCARLKVSHTH